MTIEENFYAEDHIFGTEQGLALAVTFIDARGNPLDTRYGEL